MRTIRFTMLLAFFALFYACGKGGSTDPAPSPGPGPGPNPTPTCSGTPGPLFNAVKDVMTANCAVSGCHAGSSPQNGLNLADNCTIVAQKSSIKSRAVDQAGTASQMPPPPRAPLSAADRQKITDWITAGGRLTD